MKSNYAPEVAATSVKYATEEVDGLKIAYREAGKPGNPKLVLLHGFPSSSHQYRNLIPALADRFHVISPDYPGFGNSDAPDPREFAYTFDQLAEITGKFLRQKGFDRFGLFVQDYGGPVGFRIVTKSPGVLEWLIIQNTNVYEVGFTAAWGGLRDALWHNRTPENEEAVAGLLAYDTVKAIYLHGAQKPELISPDNWHSDFFTTIQKPNGRQIQLDLFYDYRTNVTLYPKWQLFLKQNQPKAIIFWGQDDIFFTREGGEAYLDALPKAEMHRLESGHFAVEDCLEYIARHLHQFYDQSVM
ncbi:alpha/beta fold hydrolase [Granulicella sp. L46]|uniref:alpha/beta fold hydrolase n=1 Tax=Granulicella sp. L46 TaxID=1641865 RepID=UPI00131B2AAA|nr:alpha/beta hydrolase [Granulicella sp. L46]